MIPIAADELQELRQAKRINEDGSRVTLLDGLECRIGVCHIQLGGSDWVELYPVAA